MLYDRIEELCKEKHIRIARLEKECGLGNATVRGWKEADPKASKLKLVAHRLGVTTDYLLADYPEKPRNTTRSEVYSTGSEVPTIQE